MQDVLKELVTTTELVEIYLENAPTYKVGCILDCTQDYFAFCEISASGHFAGVYLCKLADLSSISIETKYLTHLAKQINHEELRRIAHQTIEKVTDFTMEGFLSAFQAQDSMIEITTIDEVTIAAKVVSHADDVVSIDEYSTESESKVARTYLKKSHILRLAIDVPWTRTIAMSLIKS